jgi:hypothetical protein
MSQSGPAPSGQIVHQPTDRWAIPPPLLSPRLPNRVADEDHPAWQCRPPDGSWVAVLRVLYPALRKAWADLHRYPGCPTHGRTS